MINEINAKCAFHNVDTLNIINTHINVHICHIKYGKYISAVFIYNTTKTIYEVSQDGYMSST